MSITVVDAVMGAGKTSAMLDYVNRHPEESFIFITPFLSEVERVKEKTVEPFYDPVNLGAGKLDSLKRLLGVGHNVVATHSLFLSVDKETENLIRDGGYTLILDEVLDVITPYNDTCDNPEKLMGKDDPRYLLEKRSIEIDEYGNVSWLDDDNYRDYKYSEVEKYARAGTLICIDEVLFLWQFPPRIFSLFERTVVLTYCFRGSTLRCYFDFFGIEYQLASATCVDGEYKLIEYADDRSVREKFKELIDICDDARLNDIGNKRTALSKNWFLNAEKEKLQQLKRNLNTYVKNRVGAKSHQIMWTCFKADYNKLVGSGYTYVRHLTPDEKKLPDRAKSKLSCHVACNARATNDFADRTVLMYVINRFPDPNLAKYFSRKGVAFDRDAFALSEMIQWIWRSAIRDGEPISVYIPSARMRGLLRSWLDGGVI